MITYIPSLWKLCFDKMSTYCTEVMEGQSYCGNIYCMTVAKAILQCLYSSYTTERKIAELVKYVLRNKVIDILLCEGEKEIAKDGEAVIEMVALVFDPLATVLNSYLDELCTDEVSGNIRYQYRNHIDRNRNSSCGLQGCICSAPAFCQQHGNISPPVTPSDGSSLFSVPYNLSEDYTNCRNLWDNTMTTHDNVSVEAIRTCSEITTNALNLDRNKTRIENKNNILISSAASLDSDKNEEENNKIVSIDNSQVRSDAKLCRIYANFYSQRLRNEQKFATLCTGPEIDLKCKKTTKENEYDAIYQSSMVCHTGTKAPENDVCHQMTVFRNELINITNTCLVSCENDSFEICLMTVFGPDISLAGQVRLPRRLVNVTATYVPDFCGGYYSHQPGSYINLLTCMLRQKSAYSCYIINTARTKRRVSSKMKSMHFTGKGKFVLVIANNIKTMDFLHSLLCRSSRELQKLLNTIATNRNCLATSEKQPSLDFLLLTDKTEIKLVIGWTNKISTSYRRHTCRQNAWPILTASESSKSAPHAVKSATCVPQSQDDFSVLQMKFSVDSGNKDQVAYTNAVDDTIFNIKILGKGSLTKVGKNERNKNIEEGSNLASLSFDESIKLKKLIFDDHGVEDKHNQMSLVLNKSAYEVFPSEEVRNVCVNMLPDYISKIPWEQFERETMRLASFGSFPSTAVKEPNNLASAGFVYVGNGVNDRVKCYFCSVEKESWQMQDNIDDVHKSLSPSCPMVVVQCLNNIVSTQSAVVGSLSDFSSSVSYGLELTPFPQEEVVAGSENPASGSRNSVYDMVDHHRVTSNFTQQSLSSQAVDAVAPYVPANENNNINRPDVVNAVSHQLPSLSQHGSLSAARSGNQPDRHSENQDATRFPQHYSTSDQQAVHHSTPHQQAVHHSTPHQQAVHHSTNDQQSIHHHPNINAQVYAIPPSGVMAPAASSAALNSVQPPPQLTYQMLGIFHERPKFPDHAILARRLLSYDGWPEGHPIKKEELAKAGLFFAGYEDCCKCFFCGGGLRNWEMGDNPYIEHARWFDKCSYIRQLMGQEFVEAVQAIKNRGGTITIKDVTDYMKERKQSIQNLFSDRRICDDAAVRSLIVEGHDQEAVARVARSLRESGEILSADIILRKLREQQVATNGTVAAAAADGVTASDVPNAEDVDDDDQLKMLKEQNSALRSSLTCKICMDQEIQIVFLPCGHLISCQECSVALSDCPVCRCHIRARARANIK